MLQKADTNPFYVFVVLTLAAFLLTFAFTRKPGVVYKTNAVLRVDAEAGEIVGEHTASEVQQELVSMLLAPEFVADAMRSADMIRGENTPEFLAVAQSIAERIAMTATSYQPLGQLGHTRVTLSLVTERPEAGISLLTELSRQAQQANSRIQMFEPFVADQVGGSITQLQWIALAVISSFVGLIGLVLADRARESNVLVSIQQAEEVLPVVADFCDPENADYVLAVQTAESEQKFRQRTFKTVLRCAELAVAAVFLLMTYQLATQQTLVERFVANPLAAYGEVLSRVVG